MKSIARNPIKENSAAAREVFIGLGSNLGDRADWLAAAREQLQAHETLSLLKASSLYETAAYGFREQPAFLNQVLEVETSLPPILLLERLLNIESALGRVRMQRWGPRTIDLDLLAYRALEINTERLQLPHPEIPHRRFVLEPWQEIAPDFKIPKWRSTIAELLARCADLSEVARWQERA